METWNIKDVSLEYDDDNHQYIADGIILPSVTQILDVRFGHKYDHVDRDTLNMAAERGTRIHKALELYCKGEHKEHIVEVRNFKFLTDKYNFFVVKNEVPILIFEKGTPIAAGRLDMVTMKDGKSGIADIKTTSTLDLEYIGCQLNLYRIGLFQSYGINAEELAAIHLRGDKRKYKQIPVNEQMAWDIIEEYRKKGKE